MEILAFIGIGLLGRLLPHLPNMTPVGAIALFTGSKYGTKKSLIIVLTTMLITDTILGLHTVMWATYGCLIATVLIGRLLAGKTYAGRISLSVFASSFLFFIVTNFAVWAAPISMYPRTIGGLIDCYIMALPFWRNSLIGDTVYSVILFGGHALVASLRYRAAYKKG